MAQADSNAMLCCALMNAGALSKSILAAAGDSIQQECKISGQFLADRTNGRAIATLLRLSSVVCRRL